MNEMMGKDENCVIASTARLLAGAMKDGKEAPELVLLRFVRGVMGSHRAWGPYALGTATTLALMDEEQTCRVCGCTERDACQEKRVVQLGEQKVTGFVPCSWVQSDLCSACVELDRQLKEEEGNG